ncbi:hypothetical protein E5D57_011021 [Metarhizium anisopliae]|nr:hypothetical protein E5D57_011021 [Metarhizium anisopliae]
MQRHSEGTPRFLSVPEPPPPAWASGHGEPVRRVDDDLEAYSVDSAQYGSAWLVSCRLTADGEHQQVENVRR